MLDYPFVLVRKVEVHPLAEVMDDSSEDALQAMTRPERAPDADLLDQHPRHRGINRTPEIAAARELRPLRDYLDALRNQEGKVLSPRELLPILEPDKYFRWAYPLPETRLYLGLSEEGRGAERICHVLWYCKGPNLGSAGGPTLQPLTALASIYYTGRYEHQAGGESANPLKKPRG